MARRGEKSCSGRERDDSGVVVAGRRVVVTERGERVRVGSLCWDSKE